MSQNRDGQTKLYLAVRDNRLTQVQEILNAAKELDVLEILVNKADENGDTPLHIARDKCHTSIVQVLLQTGTTKQTTKLEKTRIRSFLTQPNSVTDTYP